MSKSFFGDLIIDSIKLFLLFSLFVSSNYIFNDIRDKDIDKYHPEKKYRGVASGNIKVFNAKVLAFFLTWHIYSVNDGFETSNNTYSDLIYTDTPITTKNSDSKLRGNN